MVLRCNQRHLEKFCLHGRTTDDVKYDKAVQKIWNLILVSRWAEGLPHYFDMSPLSKFPPSLTHKKLALGIAYSPGTSNHKICFMGTKEQCFSEQYYILAFKDFATTVRAGMKGSCMLGKNFCSMESPLTLSQPGRGNQ